MTLRDLNPGETGKILTVGGEGALRRHFLDMGVIPGAEVTLIKFAPMGDPMELRIHGYELTLRLDDAAKIGIEPVIMPAEGAEGSPDKEGNRLGSAEKDSASGKGSGRKKSITLETVHPGLGEEGKYHAKGDGKPLPAGTVINFALAGNQNCGKTTLFNQLTGSNQHVGNFPGVTVDKKSGPLRGHDDTLITDLPGIYSLSPYTAEEMVSRQFILDEKPQGIINIVDATNIERNLYLTTQLLTLGIPMVLALNMFDEVRGNGGAIDINRMESMLGIPVVPISAVTNEGVDELVRHAYHVAKNQERPGRTDFCDATSRGGAVHRCIHAVMHLIEDHAEEAGIPARFAATGIIEGDEDTLEKLHLTQNEKETVEHIVLTMEEESGLDRAAAIADMRFAFIQKLCDQAVAKPKESKEQVRSAALDRVLTGKYTAIPVFVLIMALVFYLTFNVIGAGLQNILAGWIRDLTALADGRLTAAGVSPAIHSLIVEGILQGVGSVLSFVPVVVTLFFFLSILEDTGYMARVAFVMDKLLRKIGLSGRSIVPMLIGFGCTVPGVMATRTLPSARDRKMTIILTPFMSCTAKLPVYGFLASAFFPKQAGLIMIGLYLLGILMGILVALVSKNTMFKGEAVPFVMELPNYRLPGLKNVALLLWDKAKDFIERAFSVILIASVVIWALQHFSFTFTLVDDHSRSMLAAIAGKIAPVFALQGLDDWRIITSLVAGFMAKESVVSSLNVTFGSVSALTQAIGKASAGALLVFCLLYTPCVAAISAIRRELGGKWAFGLVVFQCVLAWVVSLAAYAVLAMVL
ncbi:MAG: ferrous iron transport protein B [Eubacteriales bacterium]|nr:ferrous iron transport protein B [Eubacteriales bacterium]